MARTFLLGQNSICSSRSASGGATGPAIKFTAAASVLLNNILVYTAQNGGNNKAAIYSDSAGSPNALLGETQVRSSAASAGTWLELPMVTPVSITSGTVYWLTWINDEQPANQYAWQAGGSGQRKDQNITYPTFPSTFSVVSSANQVWSIYGENKPASSGFFNFF